MRMNRQFRRLGSIFVALALSAGAFAHHVMGGRMPATFGEGMLSGLGHPIIGLDHFAAVVAVGCLAAVHAAGASLVVGFVLAMMAGVALHLHGATVPGAEILVALSVIALGVLMLRRRQMPVAAALCCSRSSASCTAMRSANRSSAPSDAALCLSARPCGHSKCDRAGRHGDCAPPCGRSGDLSPLRLVGAGIAGIGLAVLMQQVVPAA